MVGSDLAFLALAMLLLYVMWQLTAKQAAADAEYNLQRSNLALAMNRALAERNAHKEDLNAKGVESRLYGSYYHIWTRVDTRRI